MSALIPGRHRRTIRHLAPDTPYEVEIRQGATRRRATVRTKTYKPRKVSAPLGVVDGDVRIRPEGGEIVVERAGAPPLRLAPPRDGFVELHSGLVRGGGVSVEAPGIVLRDVDVYGAPEDAVRIAAPGAHDLRLVRCRGASWGWATRPETGFENGLGFARIHTSWLGVPASTGSVDGVLAIGCQVGAPRFSANTWQERDPAFPPGHVLQIHPDGSNAIGIVGPSFLGRGWNVRDCVMRAVGTRLYDDTLRAGGNSRFDGGAGLELVWAFNATGGAADDGIEIEGANVCNLVLGNLVDQTRTRRWTSAPLHAIACSTVMWGPLECERNLIVFGAFRGPEPDRAPPQTRSIYKLLRRNDRSPVHRGAAAESDGRGWLVVYHDMSLSERGVRPPEVVTAGPGSVMRVIGENNVYGVVRAFRGDLLARDDRENAWGESNLAFAEARGYPRFAAEGPWWDAAETAVAGSAAPLPNVNDGGPWGASRRDKGAVAGPPA
jgi:hypothetical protein